MTQEVEEFQYHDSVEEIQNLINSGAPMVWVTTHEEERFLEDLAKRINNQEGTDYKLFEWSIYRGLIEFSMRNNILKAEDKSTTNISKALDKIVETEVNFEKHSGYCYILKDLHPLLNEPLPRQLRDIYYKLQKGGKTLIILSPVVAHGPGGTQAGLPPTLEKQITVVNYELPCKKEILRVIDKNIKILRDAGGEERFKLDYSLEEKETFIRALQGLTILEVEDLVSSSLCHLKRIDLNKLINGKKTILRKSQILEFIDSTIPIEEVGGLDLAKEYLQKYSTAHSEEAKAYGVEPLKGVIFTGVPGCLHGSTEIYDPIDGTTKTVEQRYKDKKNFYVISLSEGGSVLTEAEKPFKYPKAKMIKFSTNKGKDITVTLAHRFWTQQGWKTASEIAEKILSNEIVILPSNKESYIVIPKDSSTEYHLLYRKPPSININKKFNEYIELTKVEPAGINEYYDFHVPVLENYYAHGMFHHNTGKSLLVKTVKSLWKQPLLRLDVGKVMSGLVGSSEARMREVIEMIEKVSPAILWIDEIEKSLSGTKSSNYSDGGTMARVFGTLLTAMEERMKNTTILATANDLSKLPPELIRRFNDLFFVDLPSPDERWDIFAIHLKKRKRNISKFRKHKKALLEASENYTGAEIEKAIKDAIAAAFYSKKKDIGINDLLKALSDTKPISKTMKKQIDKLRNLAKGQYRYASSQADQKGDTRKEEVVDIQKIAEDLKSKTTLPKDRVNKALNRFEKMTKKN